MLQSKLEEKKNIMTNIFPHRYDLHKKRKKTILLLNNSVPREYNQNWQCCIIIFNKINM